MNKENTESSRLLVKGISLYAYNKNILAKYAGRFLEALERKVELLGDELYGLTKYISIEPENRNEEKVLNNPLLTLVSHYNYVKRELAFPCNKIC